MAFNNGFTYRRKLTFANATLGTHTNMPVLVIVDDSASGYPDLTASNAMTFTDKWGTALSWGNKDFNDGGTSYYFVNVPFIANNDSDYIYMYYGGSTSVEAKSSVHDSNVVLATPMVDYGDTSHIQDWVGVNTLTKKGAGEPVSATGDIGSCQDFDKENDFIDCGTDASLNITDTITIEMYLQYKASTNQVQISKGAYQADGWYIFLDSNNGCKIQFNASGSSAAKSVQSAANLTGNTDYYVAITVNNTTKIYDGFVNGTEIYDGYTTTISYTGNASRNLYLGKYTTGSNWSDSLIYLVRISNTIRSDGWIKAQDKILRQQNYVTIGDQETSGWNTKIIQPSTTYPRTTKPKVKYIGGN